MYGGHCRSLPEDCVHHSNYRKNLKQSGVPWATTKSADPANTEAPKPKMPDQLHTSLQNGLFQGHHLLQLHAISKAYL